MLAAECAWAVLRSEHVRIRSLLALIEQALIRRAPPPSETLAASLLAHIERLEAFESTTHRPKGVVMVEIMRDRSPEATRLLTRLEQESARCHQLLTRAKALLSRVGSGTGHGFAAIDTVLGEHRALMLAHLDQEDTLLHSQTALLLTAQEWASVASSISEAMRLDQQRERLRTRRRAATDVPRSGGCVR
ncbi:hemerythrin domain-containing protein [Variovorax saccharolyticus]|uniref:hemerythrin domain-containing protein n=1 Tax=Variovorax saccharolyticus TaxID=3053516 RepID=UPI002574DC59|nr:hemerythrin domain-containing protein [Variovorax sp. J31P216]MDM0030373.1 hemerythrin domain-containing protein [Variovorax sp. J31P216]